MKIDSAHHALCNVTRETLGIRGGGPDSHSGPPCLGAPGPRKLDGSLSVKTSLDVSDDYYIVGDISGFMILVSDQRLNECFPLDPVNTL